MQFIKLHTKRGNEVYINVNAIVSVRYVPADAETVLTTLGCDDGWFEICETPEEILQMIRSGE